MRHIEVWNGKYTDECWWKDIIVNVKWSILHFLGLSTQYKVDLRSIKYDILRRLINDFGYYQRKGPKKPKYSKEEIQRISQEIKCKNLSALKDIHKKYLGV